MPASPVSAFAVLGAEARLVELVCRPSAGPRSIRLSGLSSRVANRLRDDVRSALVAAGYDFPDKRIVIDPRPARGARTPQSVGLAAALGVLGATGQRDHSFGHEWAVHARLRPDGSIAPLSGTIAVAEAANRAGLRLIVAPENAAEAALVDGLTVAAVRDLAEATDVYFGAKQPPAPPAEAPRQPPERPGVFGLPHRPLTDAVALACAGGHSLLLTGVNPGWAPAIGSAVAEFLPELTPAQRREILRIQSVANVSTTLHPGRPVRVPHPRLPLWELLGGGRDLAPGEASLAHHGVLVLDGLTAFPRATLAAIRSAYEDRYVAVHRDGTNLRLPTRFLLVATMASCPAGCESVCDCPSRLVAAHRAKLAPLARCFDVHVNAASVHALHGPARTRTMAATAERINGAHERQRARGSAAASAGALGEAPDGRDLDVDPAVRKLAARSAHAIGEDPGRVLRLAQTIADSAAFDRITVDCVYAARAYLTPTW